MVLCQDNQDNCQLIFFSNIKIRLFSKLLHGNQEHLTSALWNGQFKIFNLKPQCKTNGILYFTHQNNRTPDCKKKEISSSNRTVGHLPLSFEFQICCLTLVLSGECQECLLFLTLVLEMRRLCPNILVIPFRDCFRTSSACGCVEAECNWFYRKTKLSKWGHLLSLWSHYPQLRWNI